jgi:3-methylfumaryl-CoA hydratase
MSAIIERTELLTREPAVALAGLLDVPLPDLESGIGLPLTWHWLYLLDRPRQRDLGVDGHPVRNALPEPPGPGRRRMWAGGSLRRLRPLRVNEPATRCSTVLGTTEKHGRSGRLTFVTVGHTILQRGEAAVEERQVILYRDLVAPPAPYSADLERSDRLEVVPEEWSVAISPTLLFRFSALTYNGHRIHYDRDYARDHEGYPGLVVHGPLQAMAMAELARSRGLQEDFGVTFEYRLTAPLFEGQGLIARGDDENGTLRTIVRDYWGRQTAEGRLEAT